MAHRAGDARPSEEERIIDISLRAGQQ